MPKPPINEREFELINIIGDELNSSQRDLSRHMDLSLGATNMLIRRLVAKGYIRITQLNKRKVQYMLTPKGFAEKMRKSVKYTMKTLNSLTVIKDQLRDKVISKLYKKGVRNFVVLGKSDFALMIEMVFKDLNLNDYTLTYIDEVPQEQVDGYLLVCKEDVDMSQYKFDNAIDLVHELAKMQMNNNHQ